MAAGGSPPARRSPAARPAHSDYPGTACMIDTDCYVGEVCTNLVCVPNQDMTIIGDFAHPPLGLRQPHDERPFDERHDARRWIQ